MCEEFMPKKIVLQIIAFCIMLGGLTGNSVSQQAVVDSNHKRVINEQLQRQVSLDLKDVPLEKALTELSKQSSIELNYVINNIFREKLVSVSMRNVPAIEALMKLLNDTGSGLTITKDGLLAIVPVRNSYVNISGTITDAETGQTLSGVNVVVRGTRMGASTDKEGKFLISGLSPGVYSLEVSMIGYARQLIENISARGDETVTVNIELQERSLSLGEVVVTPGHFSLMDIQVPSVSSIDAENIRDFPQIGEDIFRAVKRVPGLSSNDYSAQFSVRGGEGDEVLVKLDGMELYDPFHMKYVGGTFSIIDVELIDNVEMLTGGFSAEYGKRLSGVFNIKTRTPNSEESRTSVALSLMNTRLLTEGCFDDNKGSYQFVARRGYIDLVLKLMGEDRVNPGYYDVYGKMQYVINQNNTVSFHMLSSDDDLIYTDDDEDGDGDSEFIESGYSNLYGWVKWESQQRPNLFSSTVLSTGRISYDKSTQEKTASGDIDILDVNDTQAFNYIGISNDWRYEYNDQLFLQWGFDYKNYDADYDYTRRLLTGFTNVPNYSRVDYNKLQTGSESGGYFKSRLRVVDNLIVEGGIRHDNISWTSESYFSPRFNVSYNFDRRTTLRAAWGIYYQPHHIHKLSIMDGEEEFSKSDKAEHFICGIEHVFDNGFNMRIEAYRKNLLRIMPRYFNYMEPIDLDPETSRDRIGIDPEDGISQGIEFYFSKDNFGKHSIWFNYALSLVEENFNGRKVPRSMDQRHTINVDYKYKPSNKWSVNLAWVYHSGWPYTDDRITNLRRNQNGSYSFMWAPGPINALRLPAYHRMDIRFNRNFVTSKGEASVYVEVRNLYNRKNVYYYGSEAVIINENNYYVNKEPNYWLPLIPSVGVSWDF